MSNDAVLHALAPVIVLLFLGVVAAIGSRKLGLSPIVGYLGLGVGIRAAGFGITYAESTIDLLASLGVMLLLFDIGLHFSVDRVKRQASEIFGFGVFQVLFATTALAACGLLLGLSPAAALLVGVALSLSSTAVVERLISERHQTNCPVGSTAVSILVFQDVAAMLLLIIAGALTTGGSVPVAAALALGKAAVAFGVTLLIAKYAIRPVLEIVARTNNNEVFTATALLISLAASWLTGTLGLSLTLGAFLGGLALAETPYRPVISSEIRPFRGLLLGFFFLSIGLSLDARALLSSIPLIIGITVLMVIAKTLANVAASRLFKWSVPGSTQLGFLIAQGSEFAFVIFALPPVRELVGTRAITILIAVVTLSIAITPNLASFGRALAGRMRSMKTKRMEQEQTPLVAEAPVLIVGMGTVGRFVADALRHFNITYQAVERDQATLNNAIADGYEVAFADGFDLKMWEHMDLHEKRVSVITAPQHSILQTTASLIQSRYPKLKRFAVLERDEGADLFRAIGIHPVLDGNERRGHATARAVLKELGVSDESIVAWLKETASAEIALQPKLVATA